MCLKSKCIAQPARRSRVGEQARDCAEKTQAQVGGVVEEGESESVCGVEGRTRGDVVVVLFSRGDAVLQSKIR